MNVNEIVERATQIRADRAARDAAAAEAKRQADIAEYMDRCERMRPNVAARLGLPPTDVDGVWVEGLTDAELRYSFGDPTVMLAAFLDLGYEDDDDTVDAIFAIDSEQRTQGVKVEHNPHQFPEPELRFLAFADAVAAVASRVRA